MAALLRLALCVVVALSVWGASAQPPSPEPDPPARKDGETAAPAVDLAKAAADARLARQDLANRQKSQNNIQQLGLAVHNYHDAMGRLPDDLVDRKGKALLSWRVALLPYLEQDKLYKEFRLDEPWDSKHNLKLLEKMPDVFRSPRVTLKGKGHTVYQVFRGPNAVFGRGPMRITGITDGTSNTILAVEATDAVAWTKPADVPFDRTKAVPDFGKAFGGLPLAVLLDGSIRVLDLKKIRPDTLKNAIDPQDGNVMGADWSR